MEIFQVLHIDYQTALWVMKGIGNLKFNIFSLFIVSAFLCCHEVRQLNKTVYHGVSINFPLRFSCMEIMLKCLACKYCGVIFICLKVLS